MYPLSIKIQLTNIFERLSKLGKLVEALLYNIGGPLVDFVVLVGVTSNGSLHSFLDDVGHFIYNKCCLIERKSTTFTNRIAS